MILKFNTSEAAKYLGFADTTIRNSRHTGQLAGVKAPPYSKIGRSCRYDPASLDLWLAQFGQQSSTSEIRRDECLTQQLAKRGAP